MIVERKSKHMTDDVFVTLIEDIVGYKKDTMFYVTTTNNNDGIISLRDIKGNVVCVDNSTYNTIFNPIIKNNYKK